MKEEARRQAIINLCKVNGIARRMKTRWIGSGMPLDAVAREVLDILEERHKAREKRLPTTVVSISGILGRLNALEERHGSLRAVARVLKIDAGYLSRLKAGAKLNPSDAVLRKLGLRRHVQFSERFSHFIAAALRGP